MKLTKLTDVAMGRHWIELQTAVKGCKQVNKNLSDMGRELESIGQVTSVGDLPEKLAEVEEAKVLVEGQLLERVQTIAKTNYTVFLMFGGRQAVRFSEVHVGIKTLCRTLCSKRRARSGNSARGR